MYHKEIKAEENATALKGKDTSLQGMLEEASKMLRVELRKELQSMEAGSWRPSMKMFRSTATVARIKTVLNALLDTGATHAMRPKQEHEKLRRWFQRSEGELSSWGNYNDVDHQDQHVEPIIPVGRLVKELGCKFEWKDGNCTLNHPGIGEVVVVVVENCPQIASEIALQVIEELEDGASLKILRHQKGR